MQLPLTRRLPSLRQIYLSFAAIAGMVVIALAWLAHGYLTSTGEQSGRNIEQRDAILHHSRQIKGNLWEINSGLDAFLLSPSERYRRATLAKLVETHHHSEMLMGSAPLKGIDPAALARQLLEELEQLEALVHELLEVRVNANQQYPTIRIVREVQFPNYTLFVTNIDLLLNELLNTAEIRRETLQPIYNLRYRWAQMISQYRLYLANQLSSFNEAGLRDQEEAINIMYAEIIDDLAKLEQLQQQGTLDLLDASPIEALKRAANGWYDGYLKIRQLQSGEGWRTDIRIVEDRFRPLFDQIIEQLNELDRRIDQSAASDVNAIARVATTIGNSLWLMSLLGLFFISVVYLFFNTWVLKPIALVARALIDELHNREQITLMPRFRTRETQDLINAFSEMHRQVNARQSMLEHQALHDALTGLPNRALINDRIDQAILTNRRNATPFALIMMDLDRFKEINDTLGHHAGDDVLCQISTRLRTSLRESDTIARLGGDEFAILLPSAERDQAAHLAEKVITAMEQVFHISEHRLYVGGSLGIALFPEHGDSSEELLQRADVAMYLAKRGNHGYAFYNPDHDEYTIQHLELVSDLRHAIDHDELMLHFQPQLDLKRGTLIGVESLLRWNHREHGFIPPDEMVVIAEKTGLIKSLTLWVLREAISQCARWRDAGLSLRVAVNLSVWNLQDPELPEQVANFLEAHRIDPEWLTLEITEGAMMANPESAIHNLSQLDAMGIWLSIDDFGTGFSSLAYLKRLPVDELKIDRSFVMDMVADESDASIVRSTIDLAHNLGLKVVAEGIEDEAVLEQLSHYGCDFAQGYHIGRPMSASALDTWLGTVRWPVEHHTAQA